MDIQNTSLTKSNLSQPIFSTLFQNMFDSVVIYNYETETINDCNLSVIKLLGYTKEELIQKNRFDLMPSDSVLYPGINIHEIIRKDHRQRVLNGDSVFARGELETRNGDSVFAEMNIIPFQKGTGDAFVIIHDITKLIEDQHTIEENKKEYKLIFNNAREAIVYFDLKTEKLVQCNDLVKEMFGVRSVDEFLNADFSKFYSSKIKTINPYSFTQFFKRSIHEAIKEGDSCHVFLANKLNGENFIAELTTVYVKSQKSKVVFFIKDISKAYYAQKDREQLFHEQSQILNAMSLQFSQKDLKNNIVKYNTAMKNFIAPDAKDIVGKNLGELIGKEDAERSYQEDLQIIKTKTPKLGYTFSIKDKNGKPIYGKVDKLPLFDKNKEVSGIITYVADITNLIETQTLIKESERNYRALFDNAFDGILVYDCNENKTIRCNLNFADFLSTTLESIVNNSLNYFSPEFQSNGLKSNQHFDHIINKTKKRGKYETEWTFIEKNGDALITEMISFLLPQENNCQIVFIFKDITERKETETIIRRNVNELNKKNEELKKYIESNKQLDNFAAIASHDLQAPLRTIHSYTQLLQKSIGENATPNQKECMHFITNATSNMRHLIRDLRTFSKVDATKIYIRSINTKHMIEEVLSELKSSFEYKNAIINIPEEIPLVLGDRVKLKQLFQNFFTNALKYIDDDVQPKIQIECLDQEKDWQFRVKDNGIGISEENQKRVFQLFTRLHSPEEYTGTGIGLSLCKKVVDQHFGNIGVDSKVGQGSTFHFTIPKDIQERYKDIP